MINIAKNKQDNVEVFNSIEGLDLIDIAGDNETLAREFFFVIFNGEEKGLSIPEIVDMAKKSKNKVKYLVLADELAPTTGNRHTTGAILFTNPMRRSTLFGKNWFYQCFVRRSVSFEDAINYVKKIKNHANKHTSMVDETITEYGTPPIFKERKEKELLTDIIYRFLEEGMTTTEMIKADKRLINKIKVIDETRQLFLAEKYMSENRIITTNYLFGPPASGKTRSIFDSHPAGDICRITSYSQNGLKFDSYSKAQGILVFEEFDSTRVPIEEMLNYLDIYPLMLPARYNDRVACFKTVYITSNTRWENVYKFERAYDISKYMAFERRVHNVIEFNSDGSMIYHKKTESDNKNIEMEK